MRITNPTLLASGLQILKSWLTIKKSNMETFKIEVKETLSRIIEIEANSVDEAFSKIQNLYKNEKIVLDADDYVETEFLKSEE